MGAPLNNINQNWEKAILNKLSKTVSVREQHFTEEEKAQARENLGIEDGGGGTGDAKFFEIDSQTTTGAEMKAAYDAGKILRFKALQMPGVYVYEDLAYFKDGGDYYEFWFSSVQDTHIRTDIYDSRDGWMTTFENVSAKEEKSNKVTSWSNVTTNGHYPSEKLVKDSLDAKYTMPSGGIPASDLADGVMPTIPVANIIPANGMKANVHYALGTLTGNVSITIDSTSEVAGMMNIYSLSFVADSTAPTITFPSSITGWAGNCLDNTTHGPVITAGKAYEFTLEDNLAVINQFEA